MIISHTHKYLFIENPLTASWAIHRELCDFYEGVPILDKHSSYHDFLRIASPEERQYFVFATVRNPLDKIVSGYCKLKDDHKGAFSSEASIEALKVDYVDREKYKFVNDPETTFADFFRRYYSRPYGDMLNLSSEHLDVVMRYEHLQEDFSAVLDRLGIEQVRPIPVRNKTKGKKVEWLSYYSPDIREHAKKVCGPFMRQWGYTFPPEWGDYRMSLIDRAEFQVVNFMRKLYLDRLRYNDSGYAKLLRKMRAHIAK